MKVNPETFSQIARPMYIVEERRLRSNLQLIADVAQRADVEIILAFKAFALWKSFPIFRQYIHHTTASSLFEARLAKEEFGMDGDVYFTDGPCVIKHPDGRLFMTWSSWSDFAYAVGIAVSESGSIHGPWKQLPVPLYPANGGHGMLFYDADGKLFFTLHTPNDKYLERPVFLPVSTDEGLSLKR